MIDIGSRLELFVDSTRLERLDRAVLRLHSPHPAPLPRAPVRGAYMTVIKDDALYRAYYRAYAPGYTGSQHDGNAGEITCYAESSDGHEWAFPELGLFEVTGSRANNVVLAGLAPCHHNFSPFLDARPGVDPAQRYKALAGTHNGGGLFAFTSPDGIHWSQLGAAPAITASGYAFDSQNVSFWSEVESAYICYFRTWETSYGSLRTISRTSSTDFVRWTPPVALNPNLPGEHLYTSQTHPYFRAPHIYVALSTRFMPDRGNSTEIVFMTSRAGAPFERPFKEAFIRPGLDPERWGNRANYAALNVVPTGPDEMSIYHAHSGLRYVLRTDGFASLYAGYDGGEALTKPLIVSGSRLYLNVSTAASGSVRVELQSAVGVPLPGFTADDCLPMVADRIACPVIWKGGADVSRVTAGPLRLRFLLRDADIYAFQFMSK